MFNTEIFATLIDIGIKIAMGVYESGRGKAAARDELMKVFGDDIKEIKQREEFIADRLQYLEALVLIMEKNRITDVAEMKRFLGDNIIDRYGPRLGRIVFDGRFRRVV